MVRDTHIELWSSLIAPNVVRDRVSLLIWDSLISKAIWEFSKQLRNRRLESDGIF